MIQFLNYIYVVSYVEKLVDNTKQSYLVITSNYLFLDTKVAIISLVSLT